MKLYCGMDLHSTNTVIVIINDQDQRMLEVRCRNDLAVILGHLEPHRDALTAIAVESTYNWYWLVDGLMDHGYEVQLVNTAAVQQYDGLKYAGDRHDAFWLAHLMRLGILPTGYIYPRPERYVRDLMRKRLGLVRERVRHILSIQNGWIRQTGERLNARELRKRLAELSYQEPDLDLALWGNREAARVLDQVIERIEARILEALRPQATYGLLRTVTGVGEVMAPTIALETGDIRRFSKVGCYTSYCRCVASTRISNEKVKGVGNRKCGNKYLSWAYSEVAHFAVRYDDRARRFYDRKRSQRNGIVAIRAVAHKMARACYYVMRDQAPYDSSLVFGKGCRR